VGSLAVVLDALAGVRCSYAAGVVDAVLIPEVPFTIKGDNGLFKYLDGVLEKKGHCVVCVAEGAGQVDRNAALLTSCALGNDIIFCRTNSHFEQYLL
jgi:6-phosphofructokinase 1